MNAQAVYWRGIIDRLYAALGHDEDEWTPLETAAYNAIEGMFYLHVGSSDRRGGFELFSQDRAVMTRIHVEMSDIEWQRKV